MPKNGCKESRAPRVSNQGAGSTYLIKHQAEPEIGWIAAGIFTASAIGAGFIVKRCGPTSPNAYLNIARITTRSAA